MLSACVCVFTNGDMHINVQRQQQQEHRRKMQSANEAEEEWKESH